MTTLFRTAAHSALRCAIGFHRRAQLSAAVVLAVITIVCASVQGCRNELAAVSEPVVPACTDVPTVHAGRATYYTFADGGGSCMFDPTPGDLFVAAMNAADYEGAFVCGMSVKVTGPKGSVVVRIVDKCPECGSGDLDLSPQAFAAIGTLADGNIPIHWQMVASTVTGPIVYHFKAESNQWWTAVQVRNSLFPVRTLEYRGPNGAWRSVARTDYNYFVEPSGMGPGPYTFRVTDLFGRAVVDSGVVHAPNTSLAGQHQFPACTP